MPDLSSELQRLLRAASAQPEAPAEAPFGFDTRVVAQWRARRREPNGDLRAFARIIRRVAVGALLITTCAGAGAWWQLESSDELDEATTNAYAIADSVIEAGSWQ
jgi:hypothetical protein